MEKSDGIGTLLSGKKGCLGCTRLVFIFSMSDRVYKEKRGRCPKVTPDLFTF